MSLKLHVETIPGNLFFAATTINKWGWAEYLVGMEFTPGGSTQAVFKMPAAKVHEIRANNPSYVADPHHDDYTGPDDPYASDFRLSQVLNAVEHKVQETHPPQEAKQDAVSSSSDKPIEETKPTRKKPQPKPKQEVQVQGGSGALATDGQSSGEALSTPGGNAVQGAAERAASSNLPDWAK